jgi:tetratricopeptide (TPR) repeat protein
LAEAFQDARKKGPGWRQLIRFSAVPSVDNFTGASIAYNLAGQYEKSAEVSMKAIQRFQPNYLVYLNYSISTSLLGRTEEARASVNELLRLNPQFSIEQFKAFMSRIGMKDQTAVEKFVEALRKAGLPETTAKG